MPVWMGEREGLIRIWLQRCRPNDNEVWQGMHPTCSAGPACARRHNFCLRPSR
jgi:hypothetical protein